MNENNSADSSTKKHWYPMGANKLQQLRQTYSIVKAESANIIKQPNDELLETLIAKIDAEIIIVAKWISKNKVPKSAWYDGLLENSRLLGHLRRELQFYLKGAQRSNFTEINAEYGNVDIEHQEVDCMPDVENYNEEQYVEFLEAFDGRLEISPVLFKNNFNELPENKIYHYFHKALVNEEYMSEINLKKYLVLAFEKKEMPKKKFILSDSRRKTKVRAIFRGFQKMSKSGMPKANFVRLLSDYFSGYDFQDTNHNWTA